MSEKIEVRPEGAGLVLEFDPRAGTAKISRADGSISFAPLVCRASFREASEKAHDPVSSLARPWQAETQEVNTPLGEHPGIIALLDTVPGLPARITWEIAIARDDQALARISLENKSERPIKVFHLSPLAYRGADPGLDMGAGYPGWRIYRTGYQSWSPAGSMGVMDHDYKPRFFLPSRSGTNPRTPYSRRPGEKASDWMAQLVENKLNLGALMGFITSASMAGRVEFEVKYDRFRRLEAVSDAEGVLVDPGGTISSEWCLLSLSRDPMAQHGQYLDAWGEAMQARKAAVRSGWCSWYFSFWNVTEKVVDQNLNALEGYKGVIDQVQIDDGFEPTIGEWLEWNEKFPTPPRDLAARIKERGFEPGVWMAPFLVSRKSPLFIKNPDWVIKTEKGRPLVAFVHPAWKGNVIYALDTTHPGVLAWLKETVSSMVRDLGFPYLKLDFLYAASLPGVRHDRMATGTDALRRGLTAIREAAGEDTYILGCGCPLGPAVGLVDSMRVSQDIDIRWKIPAMDFISGVPSGPGAKNCLKNDINRALMHNRLWVNDPDCVVMRKAAGGMAPHEIKSQLTVYYLSGGAMFLSEDVTALPPERLEWFLKSVPPSGESAIPVDLFEKDFPEILLLKKEDSALLAVFNWEERAGVRSLDLERLGLSGAWHAFDYWESKPMGKVCGNVELGMMAPRAVRYMRLVREGDRPRLLATDLHMGMGEFGIEQESRDGSLTVKAALPGKRKGKIWAVFPDGKVADKEIEMKDAWEGTIDPPG